MTQEPKAKPAAHTPEPAPKVRRWLVRIGVALGVLLVGLVVATPWIASSSLARDYAVSSLNGTLRGKFSVERVSTSWLGPTEVWGFRARDPEGRDVLTVAHARISKGLLGLARTWQSLGDGSVESARMTLYEDADGGLSLVRAFSLRAPTPPTGRPYPAVRVKARLTDVLLKIVRADNASWELTRIEGDAEMDTLGRYKADLSARTEGAGKLHLTADVGDLLRKNVFDLFGSTSNVKVTTEEPVEAGPLLALLGLKDTRATLQIEELRANIGKGSTDLRYGVRLEKLRPAKPDAPGRPISATLSGIVSGNFGNNEGSMAGTLNLSGDPGTFSVETLYRRSQLPLDFSLAGIMDACVSGDPRGLPDVHVEANGFLDLGALGQAAPALLGLQPGVAVTSGRLDVRNLRFFTRDKISHDPDNPDRNTIEPPSAEGSVEFKDLVAVRNSTEVRIEPASFDFSMRLVPDKGLEVRRAELKSAFATVAAAGTRETFAARFDADLARLYAQIRPVFDLGAFELDGRLKGELVAVRPSDNELGIERINADARSLLFRQGERRLAVDAATLSAKGLLRLEGQKPVRYEVTESAVDIDCTTVGRFTGWADVKTGAFHADATLDRADVGNVLGKLSALKVGSGPLARWGGRVATQLTLDRAGDNAPIVSTGALTAHDLTLDGVALPVTDATAEWKNAALGGGYDNLTLPSVAVKSSILAAGGDVSLAWGKEFTASGKGRVIAHLGQVLPIVSRAAGMKGIPDVAGALDWTGEMRLAPGELAVKSTSTFSDLVLRVGDRVERAAKATVVEDTRTFFKDGGIVRLEAAGVTFDIPGKLVGSASGWAERAGPFDAKLDLAPADVAFADAWLRAFGVNALSRWGGSVDVKATARREAPDKPILSEGSATARDARLDGKPLGLDSTAVTWNQAELASTFDALKVAAVGMVSDAASAKGLDVAANWSKDFELSGKLSVKADAKRTLDALQALTGSKSMPPLTGWVAWAGDARTTPLRLVKGTEVSFDGQGEVRNAQLSVGGAPRDIGTGTFTETMQLAFRDGKPSTLNVPKADLRFEGKLIGSGTLTYDFVSGAFKTTADVEQADVATAADWADGFGISQLKRYAGTAQIKATASRASDQAPLLSDGSAVVRGVRVKGKPVPNIPDVTVEWRGAALALAAPGKDFEAKSVTLTTVPLKMTAEDIWGRLGDAPLAKGKLSLTADLAAVQPGFVQVSEIAGLPEFAGKLTYAGVLDTTGRVTSLDGKSVIENFRLGTGPTAFADPKVMIDARAEIDPFANNLGLNRLIITSTPVVVTASGLIRNYKTDRQIDLRGEYGGAWERILPLAYQFYPSLRGRVLLSGPTGGPFTLKGSLNALSTKAPYLRPGLEGTARVGWNAAEVTVLDYPFRFGPATLDASMKDGKVTLPPTPVPAAPAGNGRLVLAGTLDLTSDPPVFRVPGRQVLVENFKIDREFAAKMLNRFNPVFGGDAEGRTTVAVQDLVAPLSEEAAKTGLSGSGRIELAQLKVDARGFLGEILKLLDLAPDAQYAIPPTGADFLLSKGRVEYHDFRLQVSEKSDLRFSGSVGLFDDHLDMVVSVPAGSGVLERVGVRGKLAERLAGGRIEIPIGGSRRAPKLDLGEMLKRLTIGAFGRLLGGEDKPK